MIVDAGEAAQLAREMLSEIAHENARRFEDSQDRVHELKKEIADARLRFKREVAPRHHDAFEHEVRAWAKHGATPKPRAVAPSPPHGVPGRCDNCGRPNDPGVTVCASCGYALATVAPREAERAAPAPPKRATPAEDVEKPRPAEGDGPNVRVIAVIALALFAALGLAAWVGERREKNRDEDDKHHEPSAHAHTSGVSTAVKIPSCRCFSAHDNPPTEVLLLAPPSDRTQPWSVDIRRAFGRLIRHALPEQAGAVLSASTPSLARDVGIACDEKVFVLIADDRASAWSSTNAAWRWNAALPEAFSVPHVEGPVLEGSSITSTCTELHIAGDHVVVPLASGKTAKLALADGRSL